MMLTTTAPARDSLIVLHRWLDELNVTARRLEGRRAVPRQPVHGPVRLGIRRIRDGRFTGLHDAWATDLSAQGIGLLLERRLDRDLELQVDLEPMIDQPCVLDLRIVYCQKLLERTHRIGGVFPCLDEPWNPPRPFAA